jgi:hypothetical protein
MLWVLYVVLAFMKNCCFRNGGSNHSDRGWPTRSPAAGNFWCCLIGQFPANSQSLGACPCPLKMRDARQRGARLAVSPPIKRPYSHEVG